MPENTLYKRRPSERDMLSNYLVASARLGERQSWDHLFRLWQPRFLAHGWRLTGDREIARDAVQSAWSDIYRSLNSLAEDRAFAIWAYRIISRKCMRRMKKDGRLPVLKADMSDIIDPLVLTDDHITIAQAVAYLPRHLQAALALFYRDGLHIAEIAIALDIPEGTVKSRLTTARTALRTILEKDE